MNIQRLVKFISNNILQTNNSTSIEKILLFPTYQEVYKKVKPLIIRTMQIKISLSWSVLLDTKSLNVVME